MRPRMRYARARVFVTQLEQPVDAALPWAANRARGACITVLNPAPAIDLDDAFLG